MDKYICLLILVCGFYHPLNGQNPYASHDENVKVTTEKVNGTVHIKSENKNPFTITVSVSGLRGKNIRPYEELPAHKVIEPGRSQNLFSVTTLKERREYHVRVNYTWTFGDIFARHNDNYVYRLPFREGEEFTVGQAYGGSFSHRGKNRYAVDFNMETGTHVVAAREGVVALTRDEYSEGDTSPSFKDKSNHIIIEHSDGTFAEYAHLKLHGVWVSPGEIVRIGQTIGLSGNTGYSSGPHLHFMVFKSLPDGTYQTVSTKIRTAKGIVTQFEKGRSYSAR